jgi:hypothetical protein
LYAFQEDVMSMKSDEREDGLARESKEGKLRWSITSMATVHGNRYFSEPLATPIPSWALRLNRTFPNIHDFSSIPSNKAVHIDKVISQVTALLWLACLLAQMTQLIHRRMHSLTSGMHQT